MKKLDFPLKNSKILRKNSAHRRPGASYNLPEGAQKKPLHYWATPSVKHVTAQYSFIQFRHRYPPLMFRRSNLWCFFSISKHKPNVLVNPTTIIIGDLRNTELDTLWFFRFGAADSHDSFQRDTSSKISSLAGVAAVGFKLIGSVRSWQSEFKVVTFCIAKLQS